MVKILNRRKFKLRHHHFVSRSSKIQTRSDHRLRLCDIVMKRNLSWAGADERRYFVAHTNGHLPPTFFPRAHAAMRSGIGVSLQTAVDSARHRAKRIADHVGGALQNWKFAPPR